MYTWDMKKKIDDPVITKSVLKQTLDDRFESFEEKVDKRFLDQDEKARGYRDEILNKLDEVMGELENSREDRLFIKHDIHDLQERMSKVEKNLDVR